jgi:energy-coupling factor transport system substrate-specific component
MVAVGWVGMGAGVVPRFEKWPLRIAALALYGFLVAFAFGALMNLWSWPYLAGSSAVGWRPELGAAENVRSYARFYMATSLGWDIFGAIGNAVLVVFLGRPLLGALDRAARRMHLNVS